MAVDFNVAKLSYYDTFSDPIRIQNKPYSIDRLLFLFWFMNIRARILRDVHFYVLKKTKILQTKYSVIFVQDLEAGLGVIIELNAPIYN